MKKIFAMFVLLMLSLLVACDSSNLDTTADTQQQDEQQAVENQGNNQQEETNAEETDTPENDNNEPNDKAREDSVVYEEFQSQLPDNPEYQVEYELTHTTGDKEDVTIYTKDEKTRMEVESDDEILTAWMNGESVAEYEGQCVDLSTASQFGYDPESIYQETTVEGTVKTEDKYAKISSAGTKSIAGKTTECFELVYETSEYNQLTTYCLTDEGIPALIETVNKNSGELVSKAEATVIESSVSDSKLEPCQPNMDVSGMI